MTDAALRAAGPQPPNPNNWNLTADVNTPAGTPLAQHPTTDNLVVPARANSPATTYVLGLASGGAADDGKVHGQYAGPLSLPTDRWDLICGTTGGLEQGEPYYLSADTAGKLTSVAPTASGLFRAPVGVAMSPETMMIQIMPVPLVNPGE